MVEYYFDIETYSPNRKPNLKTDKIISIQFQRLSTESGQVRGNLIILKEWESSEEEILQKFFEIFNPQIPFDFVPIGMNLIFDFFMLFERWKKMGFDISLKNMFYDHPWLDIKPIIVILNKGSFKRASLDRFTGKRNDGKKVLEWYEMQNYDEIVDYINEEATEFISFYQKLKKIIPISVLNNKNSKWEIFSSDSKIIK